MDNEKIGTLINKVLPDLFKNQFLPLLDKNKKDIESAIGAKASALDTEINSLQVPKEKKDEVFDMGSIMFFLALLAGAYEFDNNESFYTDTYGNRILKMKRQKLLREFALKLLSHYFADRLGKRKENITMYLVGMSEHPAYSAPVEYASAIAETDDPVLITGETGTGKELLAKAVHYLSRRKRNVFIPVNCGGINEGTLHSELFGHVQGAYTGAIRDRKGVFEAAKGGTVFLDEVGDMPPTIQIALLRTLNDGEIQKLGDTGNLIQTDVRIMAATNKNIRQEIKDGRFREDLYYRLCVHPIRLPSFRELSEQDRIAKIRMIFLAVLHEQSSQDIKKAYWETYRYCPTFDYNLKKWRKPLDIDERDLRHVPISKEAMEFLIRQDFPGNYRLLSSVLKDAWVKTSKRIEVEHLSKELLGSDIETVSEPSEAWLHLSWPEFQKRIENLERERINRFLKKANSNVSEAARNMRILRHQLEGKMKRLGLKAMKE